jgi:hypothetical protein
MSPAMSICLKEKYTLIDQNIMNTFLKLSCTPFSFLFFLPQNNLSWLGYGLYKVF